MALNIKDPETDRLARQLAAVTGESITDATRAAISERLARLQRERAGTPQAREVARIQARVAQLPIADGRSADDILGYDDDGLPG